MRKALRNQQEVCQAWAQQSQHIGYAGNVSFDGPTIFSYGWWPMASFAKPNVVLVRNQSYSRSTSNHQCGVRRAIFGKTVYYVPTMDDDIANVADYLLRIRAAADDFWNCRDYAELCRERYDDLVATVQAYIKEFDVVCDLPALFGLELSGKLAEKKIKN